MPKRKQISPGPEAASALPWEQQPGETDPAFAAFRAYRDQGEQRAIRAVARQVGKNPTLIGKWSSRHGWVERARAYDAMLDREAVEAARKETRAMAERHARQAVAVQGVGMRDLGAIARQQQDNPDVPALPAGQVLAFITEGMRNERVARGEPGDVTRTDHGLAPDPRTRAVVSDPDVQEAARELVRRAARARDRQPGGPGNRNEQ